MNNNEHLTGTVSTGADGVTRRTVVRGAAWSIPVIATAVAVPAASASSASCANPFLYQVTWDNFVRTSFSGSAASGNVIATPLNGGPLVALALNAATTGSGSSLNTVVGFTPGTRRTFTTHTTSGAGIPGGSQRRLDLGMSARGGSGQLATVQFSRPVQNLSFGISNIDGTLSGSDGYSDMVSITPGFAVTERIEGTKILGGAGTADNPWYGDGGGTEKNGYGYVAVQYGGTPMSELTIDYKNGLSSTFSSSQHFIEISTLTFSVCP